MHRSIKKYALRVLEYDDFKKFLAGYAMTEGGEKRIEALEPMYDRASIDSELNRLTEAVRYHTREGVFPISEVKDTEEIFRKLKIEDAILNGLEVYGVLTLLKAAISVKSLIPKLEKMNYYLLSTFFATLPDLRTVVKEINGNVTEKGYIESSASRELAQIRKKLERLSEKVKKDLEEMIFKPGADKIIQDEYITVRSGRYVIPVRTDAPFPVKGIIHGTSSTGHTIFVEPMKTVELNNEIIRLREEEAAEIEKILRRYTYVYRSNLVSIEETASLITEIDLLNAKARFSIEYRCTSPDIDTGNILKFLDARHPLLERFLKATGKKIVPISAELGNGKRALIISGPNAGGKTVALKTLGLLVLMAQSGIHVPAEEMHLPVFDQILADIGDQQSISTSLSTFSAHMDTISSMTRSVSPASLILIDEVGTGTDPSEGTALAVSIIEYFKKRGALIVVTTHHGGLKIYGYKTEGVVNAAVDFDEKTLQPTYRLVMGVAGASSGIKVARQMGLEEEIIEGARRYIGEGSAEADDYLTKLRALTVSLEKRKYELDEKIEKLTRKEEKMKADFKKKESEMKEKFNSGLSSLISEFRIEADILLGELKDRKERMKLDKERMKKEKVLKEKIETTLVKSDLKEARPLTLEKIKEGMRVWIQSLDIEGIVHSVRSDGTVEVTVGKRTFRVGINDCASVGGPFVEEVHIKKAPESVSARIPEKRIASEIHVIGMRVDEALKTIDKYLDDAVLASLRSVRIVHGIGKGRLKNAVHEMLKDHPHVLTYRPGNQNEGGEGATIVELKG